jgi:predicted site-specific integrase-resolvase
MEAIDTSNCIMVESIRRSENRDTIEKLHSGDLSNGEYLREFVSTKTARKLLGVTTATLINWSNQDKIGHRQSPSGRRIYDKQDIQDIVGVPHATGIQQSICYARVSSSKQMDDLDRQINFFKSRYPDHVLVTDVASGLNWKRKGIKTILELAFNGHLKQLVVAHRDRLCRFAFELFELVFKLTKVELIVLNDNVHQSRETELADDIMSIVHVYSCRQMGRRRYKTDKSQKDQDLPKQTTI